MKISDIRRGNISTVTLEAITPPQGYILWLVRQEVKIAFSPEMETFLLSGDKHDLQVNVPDMKAKATLNNIINRGQTRICWIASISSKNNGTVILTLQIHEFTATQTWPGRFAISIDEELVEKTRHKEHARLTVQNIIEALKADFMMPPGIKETSSRALMSISPADKSSSKVVRFFGKNSLLDVRLENKDGRVTAKAYKMIEARSAQSDENQYPVTLVHGEIVFEDQTESSISSFIQSEISLLAQNADSYLRVWQMYGDFEAQALKDESDALGAIAYSSVRQMDEVHWQFHIPDKDDFSSCEEFLWDGQHKDLCLKNSSSSEYENERDSRLHFSGELIDVFPHSKWIEILARSSDMPPPPSKGELVLDVTGDSVRQERRAKARATIQSAECPMPKLGLILEGRPWAISYRKKWQKVPEAVRAKFNGRPTPGQLDALLIAINTPDIALIQGPPGTGKTQFISALLTWLARPEIGGGDIQKSTLITSFQHDAVENVANRSRVFGLPPIRIGSRRQKDVIARPLDIWMAEMRHKAQIMLKKYETQPIFKALDKVKSLYASYSVCPGSPDTAVKLLTEVESSVGEWLSPALNDRLREVKSEMEQSLRLLEASGDQHLQLLEAAVRGLRVEKVAFEDDGPRSCNRLYHRLSASCLLNEDDEQLLKSGSEWSSNDPFPFLDRLGDLQVKLLDSLLASRMPTSSNLENEKVLRILHDSAEYVQSRCNGTIYNRDAVLFKYADDLENDPYGCELSVDKYAAVLASTVGQSAGLSMNRVIDENSCFENVIVDEAARANPLDLMIPLSRVERRIILVGDHRQLPHLLETRIEQEIKLSVEDKTQEILGISLFERLLKYVKDQKKIDGVDRYARLDVQFRMHPSLAKFVSNTFYEPYGESFTSGVTNEMFAQEIAPYSKKLAVWKNIPHRDGAEHGGRSKARAVEAEWIASEARRILDAYPSLSVGIITFYSEQVKCLHKALLEHNVMNVDPSSGIFGIAKPYQITIAMEGESRKERFRVGTVDAFQGKEFDIVILSMTRSNDYGAEDEKSVRRKYGHLIIENRLCVAMSRQKRLLIVAGDVNMLKNASAPKAVPGLVKYLEFCGGADGIII